jgi:hypothetical protein
MNLDREIGLMHFSYGDREIAGMPPSAPIDEAPTLLERTHQQRQQVRAGINQHLINNSDGHRVPLVLMSQMLVEGGLTEKLALELGRAAAWLEAGKPQE